ncbi:MAG: hypothetical protein HY267_05210 [Deltaproteobacteria bacterium]|nr:hypothetical protein [Deltaproteobacteria bacterium]
MSVFAFSRLSFFLLLLVFWPRFCFSGMLGDAWSRTDRALSIFDPVGDYVSQPLEKAIPALTFKGFFRQWSDIGLHSDQKAGFRDKDFRFLQLQNLLEIELHYQLTDSLELTSVNHFLYDGVYNWQDSRGLFAPRFNETARHYHNFERIARELFLSYRTHSLDVVIGKQQVAWGKMDGRFIDMINPMDLRESVQLEASDYEYRRIPTWMANATYFFGANSLQLLYIPNFEQDRLPAPGSPWFPPSAPPLDAIVNKRKHPRTGHFGDHEYGARLDISMDPLTWGLIYFYAWNDNPNFFITGVERAGELIRPIVTPRHTRLHHLGVTGDYAATWSGVPFIGDLPFVLRVEGLLSTNVKFADTRRQLRALSGGETNGFVDRDTLRGATALELALPENTTFIFQPSLLTTFGWRKRIAGSGFGGATAGNAWNLLPVVHLERPFRFTRDRLRASITVFPFLGGPGRHYEGTKSKFVVSYRFSRFITGRLIYTSYDGGGRNSTFGQYDKWDNIGWELSYEF